MGRYEFAPFELDLSSERLLKDDKAISLTPKAFAVLRFLVAHAGKLVSKEELLQAVWPETFITEGVLKGVVAELRKALGDSSTRPRYIETAHRRGYRFIAPIAKTGSAEGSLRVPLIPIPETRYARSGDVSIAYQVAGQGPIDLVFVMGWVSHLEYGWQDPSFAAFLRRLASFTRLILLDKRGTGLSDRIPEDRLPTLDQRMDDLRAVLDAVGSSRAALFGVSEGGPLAALYAATYPEKTHALLMFGTYARRTWAPDYPWGPTFEERQAFIADIRQSWGGPVGIAERAPSLAADPQFRDWWATYLRMGASPGAAAALTAMNAEIDVRRVLPTVRIPTLVLHRTGDACLKVDEGRYVASLIPGAKFVELPGSDHLPFAGDAGGVLAEIEQFLTGSVPVLEPDRVLATVLHAAVASGPDHLADVPAVIQWHRGRLLGLCDGVLEATFDGPARALRCAQTLAHQAHGKSQSFRAGLHTGECDYFGGTKSIGGVTVELARRICGLASEGEVLASGTVRDLVAGSGLALTLHSTLDAGEHSFPLFRVAAR